MMLGSWMEKEVREQPELLSDRASEYYEELSRILSGRRFDLVLLAARGSSDNAALFARYLIEIHLKLPVSLAAPSVLTRYGSRVRYPKCLAIGISQSGMAPDVADVLTKLRQDGHLTLAITNTAGSRLTQAAEFSLLLGVGEERSVAATKTYTSSLLALYQAVRAAGADLPDPYSFLPTALDLERAREAAEGAVGHLLRSQVLFALARGYDFATAQETALKLMECALLPCKSYSIADFQHGPKALAGHGSAAVVFGEEVDGLADQGCTVVQAPHVDTGPLAPIHNIFFGQWLALLAARARALDPDDPQHIQKVTQTL
jgi:glutamine---fructose-6-phosphate transaminase (isomerizing)